MTPDSLFEKFLTFIFTIIGKIIGYLIGTIINLIRLFIGKVIYDIRTKPRPLRLPYLQQRLEHTHIVGGSGHGKTQLLQQMFLIDLDEFKQGHGSIIVIDSQADMIGKILWLADMRELSDKLILIDPSDIDHPPALNLFDFGLDRLNKLKPVDREKLINGAISL
jgi:hypothetical protein